MPDDHTSAPIARLLCTGRYPAYLRVSTPPRSPDSKYIGFDTSFTPDPGFFRVRVADGQIGRVVSLKNIHRFFPQWGEWSGMAPDGSPLVVRDISTQEIYALDWQWP